MLRPCRFHDPDRSLDLSVREIRYELAQVAMVAGAVLVLDDDVAEVGFRHQVDAEGAGADLTLGIAQAKPEHLVEFADVLLEPRREVGILGRPDLADRHGLDESNFQGHKAGSRAACRSKTARYGASPAIANAPCVSQFAELFTKVALEWRWVAALRVARRDLAEMVERGRQRPGTGHVAKKIEDSCHRVLTGFCACEVARHRTYPPLPASRKLGCPFGRPAPPSAAAGRGSPARPRPGKKVYLKTSSTFTL